MSEQEALFTDVILRERDGDVLEQMRERVSRCTSCNLHKGRARTVFGEGPSKARVVFIGESPTEADEAVGRPFQGSAGGMLDKMLEKMSLKRSEVYLLNVVCCRPQEGSPQPDDVLACQSFCFGQLRVIQPQVIMTLGSLAANTLLRKPKPLLELRGKWHKWEDIPVRPTFHPNYLARNPKERIPAMVDMEAVVRFLQSGSIVTPKA